MKLYTRAGDSGITSLIHASGVPKDDERIVFLGAMDELNTHIGAIKAMAPASETADLEHIQQRIMALSSEIAGYADSITPDDVLFLEGKIDAMQSATRTDGFQLPGQSPLSAQIHMARAVCRRAETALTKVARRFEAPPAAAAYLNRLSDYLFAYAEYTVLVQHIRDAVVKSIDVANHAQPWGLAAAKALLAAVEKKAADENLAAVVAVVNDQGNPMAVHVMDGALLISYEAALAKAYTAVALKMPTSALSKLVQPGQMFYGLEALGGGKITAIPGGAPLMSDGVLLGGLGVSGGTGAQDEALALFGATSIQQ